LRLGDPLEITYTVIRFYSVLMIHLGTCESRRSKELNGHETVHVYSYRNLVDMHYDGEIPVIRLCKLSIAPDPCVLSGFYPTNVPEATNLVESF